jgi:ABC-type glycerol-3-phosphate transport system substrate-binding protein
MFSYKRWFILMALAITTILIVSACAAGPAAAPTAAPAAQLPPNITITAWVQANQIEEYRAKNLATAGERLTKELGGKTTVKVEAVPDSAGWDDYKIGRASCRERV